MLADQEHPLEDAIADPPAEPKLVVVYRTRGIPWLLVPPLLLLAAVAAIVVYRRSERPEPWPPLAARTTHGTPTPDVAASPAPPAPADGRARVDALAELAELTGRPVATPPSTAAVGGSRFDGTPPAAVAEAPVVKVEAKPPTPAPPAEVTAPAPAPAPKEDTLGTKPAPVEPNPTVPPPPAPATPPATLVLRAAEAATPKPSAPDVFDPIVVAPPETPRPDAPPPLAEPARRDAVGFDPDARRAVIEAGPSPAPDRPAGNPAEAPAPAVESPKAEPFALDPRQPEAARPAAAARRAQQTREIREDMQAEAERRLAARLHLEALMPDLLNVNRDEQRRRREDFATMVRRLAAQDRPPFHAEIRQALREFGWKAGPEIEKIRERFGVDSVPEIAGPANRDLSGPAARLTTAERISRMRRWGLPETWILDDLREQQLRNVSGRDGARNEDEALIYAARVLLTYPPPAPRAPAPPASLAAPPR